MSKRQYFHFHHIPIGLTLLLFLVSISFFLYYSIQALLYPYHLDLGEAPVIDQAIRISRGINIYQPDINHPPYTISNYPPVYMTLLSPFLSIFGVNFWSGRLISIISTFLCSVMIGLILWHLSHQRMASLVCSGVFLSFPTILYWAPFVRVDMLGLLFSLVGLLVFITQKNQTKAIVFSSFFFCLAVYTRQSLGFTAPIAIFFWLMTKKQWRTGIIFALFYGILGSVVFFLINYLTKGGFYIHIIRSNMSPWHNLKIFVGLYILFGILFLGTIYLVLKREWFRPWAILGFYFLGSTLTAFMIGKIGSNVNYLNEFFVGICFLLGILVAISGNEPRKITIAYSTITGLVILFIFWSYSLAVPVINNIKNPAIMANFEHISQIIRSADGPIVADEYMGAVVMENKPIYIQTFDMTQLSRAGKWDQTPFLEEIAAHNFPLIIITTTDDHNFKNRWTPEMITTIQQNYRVLEKLGNTTVYAPPQ